jgi:hypothetical protein
MITRKRMALVGSLLAALIAVATRLDALDGVVVPPSEEQPAIAAAYESALEADAARAVVQLKKKAEKSTVNEAVVRWSLLWISVSTAVGGVVLLGCCAFARQQQRANKTEWSHALLLLGQRTKPETNSAYEDIPVSIRLTRDKRPKTRRVPVVATPAFSHEWKRAA